MNAQLIPGSAADFDARAATWDDPVKVARALRVAAAIEAAVPGLGSRRVFEYGCGTGLLGLALRPKVSAVTLADSSPGMLEEVKKKLAASGMGGVAVVRLDLMLDPPPPERYGLICSLMTLHHVPDTAALLRAFHAMLTPGGHVCLADLDAEDGTFHGPEVDVHHGFERATLGRSIEAAGFRDVRFETVVEIERALPAGTRRYPVFLVTAVRG